jgi:uncharacterized protein YuzE
MQIEHDKEVDAKYITFKEGRIDATEPIEDWLILDLARDGSVIGLELLDASRHNIGISTIGGEFAGYIVTEPKLEECGRSIPCVVNIPNMQALYELEISEKKDSYSFTA